MKTFIMYKLSSGRLARLVCLTLLTAAMLSSCKKKPDVVQNQQEIPVKKGETIGSPTTKTIGTLGGTMTSSDANIQLVVPAGALKSDVNISVQEIESTLGPITVGKTYRLLPENIQFEKDVELTVKYTSDDLMGTNRELLYLAYQNTKGEWHFASKTTFDPYNNLVSVKTKHFSDWTILAQIKMVITGSDELMVKESTKASVVSITPPTGLELDDLLGPTYEGIVKRWSPILPQYGSLSTNGNHATFTAPGSHRNFGSSITAYLDMSRIKTGPGRTVRDFVDHPIVLLPNEYLRRGRNDFYMTIEKNLKNGALYLKGSGSDPISSRSFYIFNSKQAVGTYPFGKFQDTYVRYFSSGANFSSIYSCKSEEKYTPGSVTITKVANGYIEGNISGYVQYTGAPCSMTDRDTARGSFRVKIEE